MNNIYQVTFLRHIFIFSEKINILVDGKIQPVMD